MKKRVIFHIGAPKTATTSFQMAACRRRNELRAEGILFPVGKEGAYPGRRSPLYSEDQGDIFELSWMRHQPFIAAFKQTAHPDKDAEITNKSMLEEWKCAIAAFRSGPEHTMIVSDETIFFGFRRVDTKSLLALFEGMDITLMFGLRHPEELLHSLYATGVQEELQRTTVPFAKFHVVPRYLQGGFEEITKHLVAAFNPSEVRPFWMSDLWASGRTILGSFLQLAGLETTVEQEFHVRPTPDEATVLFLRHLNRLNLELEHFRPIVRAVVKIASNQKQKRKESFHPETMQKHLSARFAQDVEWLEATYGLKPPSKIIIPPKPFRGANSAEENIAIIERIVPLLPTKTAARMIAMQRHLAESRLDGSIAARAN